jgi:membrane-bound lytic murein transglycosylase B
MPSRRLLLTLCILSPVTLAAPPDDYRLGAERFVAENAARAGFEPEPLRALLAGAKYDQRVIDAMERPYEDMAWRSYSKLFLTPERIQGGLTFWHANAETLKRVETRYGVKPEVIVAIIGVETSYGTNVGRFSVLDALTTLGFAYPKRADFFRSELEQYLLLTREEGLSPTDTRGSYAGALGKPQFISSSYRAFAVDFDGDGRRDLWGSSPDAIASVANYLKEHGWRAGEAVAIPAKSPPAPTAGIDVAEKKPLPPDLTSEALAAAGVTWDGAALGPGALAKLIRLDGEADEHWVTLHNFYVITRYNHSNLYAMAVHRLSEELRARYAEKA